MFPEPSVLGIIVIGNLAVVGNRLDDAAELFPEFDGNQFVIIGGIGCGNEYGGNSVIFAKSDDVI